MKQNKKRAAGILLGYRGRIFLGLRSGRVSQPGTWAFPAGTCEPGEEEWKCAWREFGEEFGPLPSFPVCVRRRILVEGPDCTFTAFVVEASPGWVDRWTPRMNDEHVQCGWFPVRSLPSPVHPGAAKALMALATKKGFHVVA